jgi:hypothetical protein
MALEKEIHDLKAQIAEWLKGEVDICTARSIAEFSQLIVEKMKECYPNDL